MQSRTETALDQSEAFDPLAEYPSDFGPLLGADALRVDAARPEHRELLETLFVTIGEVLRGEPEAIALLPRLERALTRDVYSKNAERCAVLKLLEPRLWRTPGRLGVPLTFALRHLDPRFAQLTERDFEACRQRSLHRFAAALSCKCGAFGDRKVDRAFDAFGRAAREGSRRKPHARNTAGS